MKSPLNQMTDRADTQPRIVLYSHDTLGYGHLRRNILLSQALRQCAASPDILLIAGMREAGAFALPEGVDAVCLPAYAKNSDGSYAARDLGASLNSLQKLRAATIKSAVDAFAPDLMIVDNVPRGAQFELDPTLKALRKKGRTRMILGLRDVIDDPATVRSQWLRQRNFEAVRDFYSQIWIYGDPALYDTAAEYGISDTPDCRVSFTGYLNQSGRLGSNAAQAAVGDLIGDDPRPFVMCSVGGGRDGEALCDAFARSALPPGHRGILLTGSQMSSGARHRIQKLAALRDDLTVVEFVQDPIAVAARATALIGMGGYNTATEMLSLAPPSLIVPRVRPRQEQFLRAKRMAERGLIDMIPPDRLTPAMLETWMASAVSKASGTTRPLDMGGLDRVRAMADEAMMDHRDRIRNTA